MRLIALLIALVAARPVVAQTASDHLNQAEAHIAAAKALLGPVVTFVPAGANLVDYVTGSVPGAVLALSPGGVYTGPITLTEGRTLTTMGFDANAPVRASIGCPAFQSAVRVTGAASIRGVRIECNGNDLIFVEEGGNALIEHNQIYGAGSSKKGVTIFGGQGIIRYNDIDHIYRFGQESHGISFIKGGPLVVDSNHIKAASVNFMSGGDSFTEALHPHDLTFTNNTVSKRPEWRGVKNASNQLLAAKNLFELKAMRNAVIENNTFTLSYAEGQSGVCASFSVRNQNGDTPFAVVENVLFRNNTFAQCGNGFEILARDYLHPSQVMRNVRLENVVMNDLSRTSYGSTITRVFYIEGGPVDFVIDGLTVNKGLGSVNSFITFAQPSMPGSGFALRNVMAPEGQYGIQSSGTGWPAGPIPSKGAAMLAHFQPGYSCENVTLRRPASYSPQTYPSCVTVIPE